MAFGSIYSPGNTTTRKVAASSGPAPTRTQYMDQYDSTPTGDRSFLSDPTNPVTQGLTAIFGPYNALQEAQGQSPDFSTYWDLASQLFSPDQANQDALRAALDAQMSSVGSNLGLMSGFARQGAGLANQGIGIESGFNQALMDLARRSHGLETGGIRTGLRHDLRGADIDERGQRLTAREQRRLALSDATGRGAVVSPGFRAQRQHIGDTLANQLAGTQLDRNRALLGHHLGLGREDIGLERALLQGRAKDQGLGLERQKNALGLEQDLENLGIQANKETIGYLQDLMALGGQGAETVSQMLDAAKLFATYGDQLPPELMALLGTGGKTNTTNLVQTDSTGNVVGLR